VSPFQFFAIIGSVGLLCCVVSLLTLHFLPTGYDPIRDPVSNYAVGRYGSLYRLQAFSSGICGACLMIWFLGSDLSLPFIGMVALALYSLSRLLIIFFPTDIKPPRTRQGTIHVILAACTFTGIAVATGLLTPQLTNLPPWSQYRAELNAAAWLTDVAAILFLVVALVRPFRRSIGLVERCIYVGTLLWLGIVFVPLLQLR